MQYRMLAVLPCVVLLGACDQLTGIRPAAKPMCHLAARSDTTVVRYFLDAKGDTVIVGPPGNAGGWWYSVAISTPNTTVPCDE